MKESYSDIDYSNVWDAYDIALEYLGAEELCESLAKAMGTDALEDNLKYIFRTWDIPFGDDEIDEGCHGNKSKNKASKKSMKESISDIDSFAESLIGLSYNQAVNKIEKEGFKLSEYGMSGGGFPKAGKTEYSSYTDSNSKYEIVIKYDLTADKFNTNRLNNGRIIDAYAYEL